MSIADTTDVAVLDPAAAGPAARGADVHIITPRRGALGVDLGELWRYRELLYFLVWRDLKSRYKQTVLGAGWAIIRPVMSMVVFSAVFGGLAKMPSEGVPYPIFVYAGLLPWTLFSGAVSLAGVSLITQRGLLTKVYFPRVFIPASCIGVVMVDFLLGAGVYGAIMLYYGYLPGLSVLLVPVLLVLLLLLAMGMGLLLAAVTVTYRDFRSIIPFMMQTWMYLSPVVYPTTLVPERFRWLLVLNPMTGIIDAFRSGLLNQPVAWGSLATASCGSVVIFLLGLVYFGRSERRFADVA
ncbi:MAG: ABC transporter permease [Planctomycetota bacterium]